MTGFGRRSKSIQNLIIILILILLPVSIITANEDNLTSQELEPSSEDNFARAVGENWTQSESQDYTGDINKGSDYFIKISPKAKAGQRIQPKSDVECNNFLSKTAQTAIDQAPDWLKEDLTKKFVELAQIDINLPDFSSAGFGDLDSDGDLDMVCSTYSSQFEYYRNCGTAYEPMYLRDETAFEEINKEDYSTLSEPCLYDLDGDSDLDMIAGSEDGGIYFFTNVGDENSPKFQDFNSFYFDLPGFTSPYVVDLNINDEELDLFCGAEDGKIHLFRIIDYPDITVMITNPTITGIDVGDHSRPVLSDLDNDGDLDLTIGEAQAYVNYYRNAGTNQNPRWIFDTTMYLGLPVTTQTSTELVDPNGDMKLDLVVGCNDGRLYYFENIGTVSEAQWQVWSTYKVWPGIEYYEPISFIKYVDQSVVDEYAQVILDAEPRMKDEIAFSIAHTATQVLSSSTTTPELYKHNAELMYEIDGFLDYARIVDRGTYDNRDYYSTVEYNYKDGNNSIIRTTEYPREIYYWNIVHPKISDEEPGYIDPDTGDPALPSEGKFWREYLFYHNDSAYPSDPPTDPNEDGIPDYHYPKDESPPLLKEKLVGIKYVYDSQPYNAPRGYDNTGHNNSRPWGYKEHAIEAVSNWVAKTLPLNEQESADGERPVQPVRIAHHHNGNCGELQDLSIAAARTALIPATGILLLAEDHVWNEFYERGWHQWDNYWSDGGSIVDNHMNYWLGWGQRGGSGVTKWHGDDYISDVTESYVPEDALSTLFIKVVDRLGNPVDGARVMVGSHWLTDRISGYQVSVAYPSIWNYTDNNGSCIFKVAPQIGMEDGNKNFSFKVISKIGNAERGKTEIERGQDYPFQFILDGTMPETNVVGTSVDPPPIDDRPDRFRVEISLQLLSAYQQPPNPMVGNYHPQPITDNMEVYFYIFNESNYHYYCEGNYRDGTPVEYNYYMLLSSGYTIMFNFELMDNSDWYLVWYNKHSIETYKKIDIQLVLYENPDDVPVVSIFKPKMYQYFRSGDEILVKGLASDDRGISKLILTIEDRQYDITNSLSPTNSTWSYLWDTEGYQEDTYNITIEAVDSNEQRANATVRIILEAAAPPPPPDITAPTITITQPLNGTDHFIGETIELTGTAWDNNNITTLTLTINSNTVDLLPLSKGYWRYYWDSEDQSEGEYKFHIRGIDDSGNIGRAFGNFNLIQKYVDTISPEISIEKPYAGESFDSGDRIIIEGTANDDVGVAKLELSVADQPWVNIIEQLGGNSWQFIWDTSEVEVGDQIILVRAEDEVGNYAEASRIISLLDVVPPSILITSPEFGAKFDQGMKVRIEGEVSDDVGLDKIQLTISGPGGTETIKKGIKLVDNEWSYTWEVPLDFSAGEYEITALASDFTGNSETDSINFNIVRYETADKDGGFFGLPGFDTVILIISILFIIISLGYINNKNRWKI